MLASLQGYSEFIAIQRGLMLFVVTLGGAFLVGNSTALLPALHLAAIVFCFWTFSDAINNIHDKELDATSDPKRAQFTEKLGKKAYYITYLFLGLTLFLSALTLNWLVFAVISVGLIIGFIYSAPPIRLRTTIVKPLVNFVFGAVAIFISGAHFGVFTLNVLLLTLLFGVVTTVNSIWGDLADYQSDKNSGARTLPVILGFRNGLFFTVILGCMLIPIMTYIGLMYSVYPVYYVVLAVVVSYMLTKLFIKRRMLSKNRENTSEQLSLGGLLSKDFVKITLVFSVTFAVCAFIR
ncbi:MAG: UbiA family prenyltransferase [Candidatus Bathyarchaeota archaeon]|nr:UbiA family prenyltransferase [Candidatus Bathyarchaeota archaeon]